MTYDVARVRADFPALESGWAFFDGPGGTQTPRSVGEAIAATLTGPLSNRARMGLSERLADDAVREFRTAYGAFLGSAPEGIVYGRSATQIVYDFSRHLAKNWGPGDAIVLSRLDHDSNVSPWRQAAEAAGVEVRWIDFDPETAELDLDSLAQALTPGVRLVAVTAASNLLGTMPPVGQIVAAAHAVGALVWIDAVHYAAHHLVDREAWGADFVVCSPYKFLGPHCAVLAADPALLDTIRPDKLDPATNDVPERFEFGTLPYELMAGATAAVHYWAGLGGEPKNAGLRAQLVASFEALDAHEHALRQRLETGLAGLGDRVVVHSRAAQRTATLTMTFPGRSSLAAAELLASTEVLAPAGFFYAHQPMLRLGLADDHALRVGLAPYTTESDIDRLLAGLQDFVAL